MLRITGSQPIMSTDKPSRGPCVIACGVRSCGVDARRAFPMLCLSELIDLIEQIHDGHNNFNTLLGKMM